MHDVTTTESGTHRLDPSLLMSTFRPRIVLAEDDDAMRRLLGDALIGDGYEVIELASGRALLDYLDQAAGRADAPALIVSDVRMPGLSGLQVLRAIRSWGWSVPVIMITAFADEQIRHAVRMAGAACMFSKPLDVDDLRTAVMHFLPRRGRTLPPLPSSAR